MCVQKVRQLSQKGKQNQQNKATRAEMGKPCEMIKLTEGMLAMWSHETEQCGDG